MFNPEILSMKNEEKNIRRICLSILENKDIDEPISVIRSEVRRIMSSGVSEDKAEQIVTAKIRDSIKSPSNSSIEVYSVPDRFKSLFIDPE